MKDFKNEIEEIEKKTLAGLKDFQRATVERIDYLFRKGQSRILVADEVGLGKTLIGKGVIAKTAKLRMEEGDDLFKVIYVCSNQSIANQNIKKLDVFDTGYENISETRLSMQHLKVIEQEIKATDNKQFIQLIPLTPETSFRMTNGGGSVEERALIFAVLSKISLFNECISKLEQMMMYRVNKDSWARKVQHYKERVDNCEKKTQGKYPQNVIEKINEYNTVLDTLKQYLISRASVMSDNNGVYPVQNNDKIHIYKLRAIFAEISVDMLNPDLVIMDEFQRFKFLIGNNNMETNTLTKKFLADEKNESDKDKLVRVLLLSATPYKLYSTLEEIEDANVDEHYSEFLDVMRFLCTDKRKADNFEQIWSNYSLALRQLKPEDSNFIILKCEAENAMYNNVCRTERISVMDNGDYTDDSSKNSPLNIESYDIRSYLEAERLLKVIDRQISLPVDYVKSCPYLMSFMQKYEAKKKITSYFKQHKDEIKKAKSNMLWIDKNKINRYEELPPTNARLEELKRQAFKNRSELYLWVPPSLPYYQPQGVYKDSEGFSKILVFSAWEMVPRMIGCMISYETERKTIGKLGNMAKNEDKKNTTYFAKKRFPAPRLIFKEENNSMSLFTLLYPSKTLAELYHPIEYLNRNITELSFIEREIKAKLSDLLKSLRDKYHTTTGREDNRWYYLIPMILDGTEFVSTWIDSLKSNNNENKSTSINKSFAQHLSELQIYIDQNDDLQLGKEPSDLMEVLVNIALGSPAVCIYRTNGHCHQKATEMSQVFLNRFNSTEATAVIELAYSRRKDDNSHWKDVLQYCKDGNFQAMFDEYVHLQTEGMGFGKNEKKDNTIHQTMLDALTLHTSNYSVETYKEFTNRINNTERKGYKDRLRSHFAVGFTKGDGEDSKNNRKDSIRSAFNSPLRPFVLASTSIGQEGLDFHYYCRKIMHWNLPSNPIDLEQREGRINRFKCLAIRQNIANKYSNISFKDDIWNDLFKAAQQKKKEGESELIPFWCLGKEQMVKIERLIPMYPISRDEINYERLIKVLSLYRLTLGQARQEELLEYVFNEFENTAKLKELFINLSPFSREKEKR